MNIGRISPYLLIYIILWHGKKFGIVVNADSETAESGTEEETTKSVASSRVAKSTAGGNAKLTSHGSSQSIPGEGSELINLDVNLKQSTSNYTYSVHDDVHRFIAKQNCWFNAATKRGVTFWKATDVKEYGKKVVIRKVDGESRFRVYFSADTPETEDEGKPRAPPREEHVPVEVESEKLIILNVKNKESTDEYEYDYDKVEDVHTYTANPPHLFGIVYKGKAVVWESQDGRYPNKAVVLKDQNGEPYLRVFFPEAPVSPPARVETEEELEEEELLEAAEESESEEEGAAFPGLVVEDMRKLLKERMPVSLNIKSKQTNAQYTFSKEGDIGTYTAADSFGFSSVSRNEERIWTQKDKSQIATKVHFDGLGLTSTVSNVTIELIDGTFRHYSRTQSQWSLQGNKLRLDVARRYPTLFYDYLEHHDVGTFTAKFDNVFQDVIVGPYCCRAFCSDRITPIWNAAKNEYAKKVVIYLNLCTNRASYVSVHMSKNKINHYEKRGAFWTLTVPLIELDIDKKDSCYEFYYAGYDEIRSYCANYNFVFTRVHEGAVDIWRADKKKYAKMVMMNGDGNTIPATKMAIVMENGKKMYFNREGGRWVKGEGFPPFELDLDDTFSTDYVEYEADAEKQTESFTTKHGFLMRSVVQDGVIWHTDNPKEYGVRVLTAEDKNDVLVFMLNGKARQFKRPEPGQPWSEVKAKIPKEEKKRKKKGEEEDIVVEDERKTKGIVLDLTKQQSTDKYTFRRKDEKEIYKAKDANKFKGIQVGASPGEKDKIYAAKDLDEFVTKVEIDRSDDPGFINDVLLHLVDGTQKQFVKPGRNKKWLEVVSV